MASVILEKCIFVIDSWIPLKKKVELIRAIKAHGGVSVYSVTDKTTHLVTSQEGCNENSEKVLKARELKVFVVSKEFVTDSVTAGQKLDEANFVLTSTAPPSGTVPASPGSAASSPASTPTSATPEIKSSGNKSAKPPALPANSAHLAPFLSLSSSSGVVKPQKIKSPKRGGSFPRGALTVDTTRKESPRDGSDSSGSTSPTTPQQLTPISSIQPSSSGKLISSSSGDLEDDGCKIFVGGITMEDLDALKLTKDGESPSDEVAAHIQKLKSERLLEIIRILSRFGTVVRVKQFLEKKHIFITYNTRESAIAALKSLRSLDVRHKIIQEVKDGLRAEGRQSIVAPKPNFYVRWPHDVNNQGDYSLHGFPGKTHGATEKSKNAQLSISSGEESDTGYPSANGYYSETATGRMQNNYGYGFQNRYSGFMRNPPSSYPPIPISPTSASIPSSSSSPSPFSSAPLISPTATINATAANKTGFYRPASSYMNKPKGSFFQSESESESFQNSFSENEAASRSRQERSGLNRSGGSSHPFASSSSSNSSQPSSSTTTAPSALIRMAPVLPPPSSLTTSSASDNKDTETSEFKRRPVTGTDSKEDASVSTNTNPNLAPFKTTPTDAGLPVTPANRKKSSSPMEVLLNQVRNNDSAIVVLLLLLVIFFLANVYFFLFAK